MPDVSAPYDRRMFFGLLAVGLASTVAACTTGAPTDGSSAPPSATGPLPSEWDTPLPSSPSAPTPTSAPAPAPAPGPPRLLTRGPAGSNQIALTVDDGYNDDVVTGYVDFAVRTGIHLTFSPNGIYSHAWAPHANQIAPLVERGQIQIINHTFSHQDLRKLTDAQLRSELERNDEWVSKTFRTSTRPYYRPPFGFHNAHIDGIANGLGYRNAVMWSGSYADSQLVTPDFLMAQARKYLQPGVIMLGHANHPTVLGLFDQITALIKQRNLNAVTLNEMFSTAP